MEILQLEILTEDINETAGFYNSHLGFPIVTHSKSEVSFQVGQTTLIFKRSYNLRPVYHFAFNIAPGWLNEAFAWLDYRLEIMDITPGVKIADFVNWNAKSIYFKDNNGNILEFIARYDLQEPVKRTGIENIISVSEIGVASDALPQACDALIANYNIPVFSRQPRMDNFTALGDDNGLLIFSSCNRNWYPTNIHAERFPTKLLLLNNGVKSELEF